MSVLDHPLTALLDLQNTTRLGAFLVGVLALNYIIRALYNAFAGPLSRYPGPKLSALSDLPHLLALGAGSEPEVNRSLHEKYGPVVRVGPRELSFAGGAQAWQDIYGFKKSGQPNLPKDPTFYPKPYNGYASITISGDADHSRQRKILSHAFSDRALKEQEPILLSWAMKLREKLAEFSAAGDKIDMLKMYNCTTFDVMADLTFNEDLGMLENGQYTPWVTSIFASLKRTAKLRGFRRYSQFTRWIIDTFAAGNSVAQKKMQEHWNFTTARVNKRLSWTPDRPDFWSRILAKGGKDGLALGEHHSIAATFMVAGTETTATELSGLTYHLTQNPDTMRKLATEIRAELGTADNLRLEKLARLNYLNACLQEGLRMYPPVPSSLLRITPPGGAIICGEWVPGGVSVGVNQQSTYRSAALFKNPDKFAPERWLGDPEYADDCRDALEPFSTGPRNCLGKNLAWHEMRLLLATVLLHFDVELAEAPGWDRQRSYVLWEKKPLMCRLTPVAT